MAVLGTLIAESLRGDAVLDVPLTLRRIHRLGVTGSVAGQPATWTLIDFTCADADAERFAQQLSQALSDGAWYTDYATADTKYVVFAGRVVSYPRADEAGRAEAMAYARGVGVPEAQLDWPA
jgi:hypothetical protein